MNYFPLFADLTGRPVLVVGGGSVAARKVGLLLKANAQVRIVARQLNEELSELERQNKVLWIAKEFNVEQMRTVMLVIDKMFGINRLPRTKTLVHIKLIHFGKKCGRFSNNFFICRTEIILGSQFLCLG